MRAADSSEAVSALKIAAPVGSGLRAAATEKVVLMCPKLSSHAIQFHSACACGACSSSSCCVQVQASSADVFTEHDTEYYMGATSDSTTDLHLRPMCLHG